MRSTNFRLDIDNSRAVDYARTDMSVRALSKLARRARGRWRRAEIAEIATAAILARRPPALHDGPRNGAGWVSPSRRRAIASLLRKATAGLDAGQPLYDVKALLARAIRALEGA